MSSSGDSSRFSTSRSAMCAGRRHRRTARSGTRATYDPATLRTLAGTAGLPEVFLVKNDLKTPKTYQFSGGVRQTSGSTLVTVSYNGVRGYNRMNYIHATPWGGLGPNYATAFVTDDRVKTWYDAMQLQLDRPIRDTRWGGAIAYTFARSEEQGQTQSGEIFWGFDDHYPTVPDLPRRRAPGQSGTPDRRERNRQAPVGVPLQHRSSRSARG